MVQRIRDPKTELVAKIIKNNFQKKITKLLVVGCGSGIEAAILSHCLKTDVIGIDVVDDFFPDAATQAKLKVGDAMDMDFDDHSFDFIYSYHALEHIPIPDRALLEMKRVLKPSGGYWIGTPNKRRIIGYLGSKDATPKEKLIWNFADWKAKLTGKFKNELGAHAGFTHEELSNKLLTVFNNTNDITDKYYLSLYSNNEFLLKSLKLSGLSSVVYPSIYFMGVR